MGPEIEDYYYSVVVVIAVLTESKIQISADLT